jgi:RND family efflux transporter MFP subunit
MRPSASLLAINLAVLALSAAALAGCGQAPQARAGQGAAGAASRVEVVRPERATIRRTTEQPGQVEAFEITSIYARVTGYVQKWTVDIGSKVSKGQVLAVVDVPELDAEAAQKRAMVEHAEAALAQARASEEVAKTDLTTTQARLVVARAGIKRAEADAARWRAEYQRIEQLFNQRAQTGSLVDETRSKLLSAEAAVEEVHAQVKSAEAAVSHSQATLDQARADVVSAAANIKVARFDAQRTEAMAGYATIAAPFAGVVTRRNVNVGDLTEPGTRGQPLFIVAREDLVRIAVSVPELISVAVGPGDPATIRVQALAGQDFQGTVTRTSWMLDPKSRTLRTEIDLLNPSGALRPGLYVTASIVADERKDVLAIPVSAFGRQGEQAYSAIVVDGRVVRKPVRVGLSDGNRAEILSGLQGGESVVRNYASSPDDGQQVIVIER